MVLPMCTVGSVFRSRLNGAVVQLAMTRRRSRWSRTSATCRREALALVILRLRIPGGSIGEFSCQAMGIVQKRLRVIIEILDLDNVSPLLIG